MAQFFQQPPPQAPYGAPSAQNLQFYPSSYTPNPVSGHATPSQAAYGGYGVPAGSPGYGAPGGGGFNSGFGAPQGVSGRMGEQGGLRTGWLAAFGTEGYDGEPPLLEELGVNFAHIQSKAHISSAKPPRKNRPAHNGRFRPRRPNPLLPPLRHLPAILR
ncbi:Protein transport protein yip1, partial [Lachnellula willkommii]